MKDSGHCHGFLDCSQPQHKEKSCESCVQSRMPGTCLTQNICFSLHSPYFISKYPRLNSTQRLLLAAQKYILDRMLGRHSQNSNYVSVFLAQHQTLLCCGSFFLLPKGDNFTCISWTGVGRKIM